MAFLQYRRALDRLVRGDAGALSRQQTSQAISFSRIVLIVGLVFLHYKQYPDIEANPFAGMADDGHYIATFVNSFTLFFFFSVVPLLSMVSGWLFFSFEAHKAASSLRQRIARRFSSVYLPMVFWNCLFLAVLALLFAWKPDYPLLGQLNIRFDHASVMDYINAIFAFTKHPIGFQFWFVRDLFVTALISPLLWLMLRRAPYVGMAILGVAWIIDSHLLIFFRTDVVFFFYLGGFVRIRQISLHIARKTAWWLLAAYLGVVALRTMAPLLMDLEAHRPALLDAATRSMRLLGVLACWGCFQHWAQTRTGAAIARFGGLAFFLHSAHFPLIAQAKIVLWPLLPSHSDGWMIAHYIASVTVTVAIGISAGLLLAHKAPKVFALMNGGRPGTGAQGAPSVASGNVLPAEMETPGHLAYRALAGAARQDAKQTLKQATP